MLHFILSRLRGAPPEIRTVWVPALRGVRLATQRRTLFGWREIDHIVPPQSPTS